MTMAAQYSSIVAYLAHWRALQHQATSSKNRAPLLEEMNQAIAQILGENSELLGYESADSSARRHRERAEVKLRRELIARGIISG